MKRHFLTGLKAFAVSALALAAVSCYDDSELWGELEGLEQRVAALEEKLNSEVATLNSKIGAVETAYKAADADLLAKLTPLTEELDALDGLVDGYITSNDEAIKKLIEEYKKADEALAKVDTEILAQLTKLGVVSIETNEDGNLVLTFIDKSTIEVAKPDANANNTGMITTVEVDGVTYWAVVGKDGKTTVLDAAVHPDTKLQFKVDPDTNELLVAYDGKTWEQTGVIVSDDTTINVVTGVEYNEGDDFVTIVVGEDEFVLPFYAADNSSLVLGRSEAYFVYGATKKVELKAEEIEEYYVMSKPDGWKASIEGTTLTITAPSQDLLAMGAAEVEGEVLVHASASTGSCKVVKLDVTVGVALKLSIEDGIVTLFNAMVVESVDPMWGDVWYDFSSVWFGLTPITEYAAYESFEAFMATKPEPLSNLQGILFNNVEDQSEYVYKEGEYEEFVASMSLADIVAKSYSEFELVEDEVYVMWVVPQGETSFNYDEAVSVMTDSYVVVDAKESFYNNVNMDAVFYGADGFVVGATDKAQFDEWGIGEDYTYEDALAEYLIGSYMPGPLTSFNGGDLSAMGEMFGEGAQSLTLEDIIISGGMGGGMMPMPGMDAGSAVSPDTEYFVWVLPYYAGKTGYTFEDLVLTTVQTEPLTKDESAKTTINVVPGYTSVKYTITPPTDGKFDFSILTMEEYESDYVVDGEADEDALKAGLFRWGCNYPVEIEENQTWDIEPGTEYILITYSEADGHYAFNTAEFTTYSDDQVPVGKQWITENTDFAEALSLGEARYVLDLGAVVSTDYADNGVAYAIAVSYEDLYGEDAADVWMVGPGCFGTSYTIMPTDEESGVLTINGIDVPYSNYNGSTCTFDFTEMFDVSGVEFTLSEEEIHVMIQ